MKTSFILIAVAIIFSTSLLSVRAADDKQAQTIFDNLLAAQLAGDYNAFVADADDQVKAALTKTQFDAASKIVSGQLKGGYDETFLGELNQRGYQIFLYRLRPKDGSDDMLGTMSLKDDKVAGIYFH
jgi:hypothetical protein